MSVQERRQESGEEARDRVGGPVMLVGGVGEPGVFFRSFIWGKMEGVRKVLAR